MSKKTLTSSSGRLQEVYSASTATVAVSDASIFTSDASNSLMPSESCSDGVSISQVTLPSTQYQKKRNGLMSKFLGIFKRKRKDRNYQPQTQHESWKNLHPDRVRKSNAFSYEENQSGRQSEQFYDDQVESDSSLPELVEDDERFNQHSYKESSVIDDDPVDSSHTIIPSNIESENTSFVQPRELGAKESKPAGSNFQTHMLNVQVTYNGYGLSPAQKKWLGQQVTGLVNILLDKQSVPKNMSFADDRDPPTFVPEYRSEKMSKASKFKHSHRPVHSSNDALASFNETKGMSLPRPASRVQSNVKVEIKDEARESNPRPGNIHEPLSTSVIIDDTQKTDSSKVDSNQSTFVECNNVTEDFSKKLILSEAPQHSPCVSSVFDTNASPGPCQDKGMTPKLDISGSSKSFNFQTSKDTAKSPGGLFRFQDCNLDGVNSFMFTPSQNLTTPPKNLMDFSLNNSSCGSAKDSPCYRSRNSKKTRSQTLIRSKEGHSQSKSIETSGLSQYSSGSTVLKKDMSMIRSEQTNTDKHTSFDMSPGSDLAFRKDEEISFTKSDKTQTRVAEHTDKFQSEYPHLGVTCRNSPLTSPTLKRRKTALPRVVTPSIPEHGPNKFEVTRLEANVSNESLVEMSPDQIMKRMAAHRGGSSERLNVEKTASPKPRVQFLNDGNVLDSDATKKRPFHFESRLAELQGVRMSPASKDDSSKLVRFRGSQQFDAARDFGNHRRRSIPVSNPESNAMSPFLVSGQQRWSLSPAEINAVGCYYPEEIANWSGTGPFMSNVSPRNFHIMPMLPYPTGFSGNVRSSNAGGSSENLALPASDEKSAITAESKMKDERDSAEGPKRRKWRQCLSEKDDTEVWWMPQEWANDRGIGRRGDKSNENKERELEIAKDANIEKIRMNRFVPL